jgi:hypothetical protein
VRELHEADACGRKEKSPEAISSFGALCIKPGNDLLSHARARAVPSALEGLTSEFEMGSGMAPPTSSPEKLWVLIVEAEKRKAGVVGSGSKANLCVEALSPVSKKQIEKRLVIGQASRPISTG